MNRKNKIRFLLCCIFTIANGVSFAQHNSIRGNFSVTENNGKVYMSWSINSGSTCNGIQIYRSTDSVSFMEIGSFSGICGNVSYSQSYDFIDENPVTNQVNYYRLELGNTGSSDVLAIEIIDIANSGYQIRPNPIINTGKIYFDNYKRQDHQLTLYNILGLQIYNTTTNANYFELNSETFHPGIYFFSISSEGILSKATGKLMIQR